MSLLSSPDGDPSGVAKKTAIDKDLKRIVQLDKATTRTGLRNLDMGFGLLFVMGVWAYTYLQSGTTDGYAVIAIASIIGAYMAMNIGANDVANNVGPAVGSKALTMMGALVIAAVFEAAGALIASFPDDAIVCFTDGACKGNPGPAGAGALVRLPDGQVLERAVALGRGTNNVGELTAIGVAMDLLDEADVPVDAEVHVLTDSKYSNGVLVLGWKAKANRELIAGVKAKLAVRKPQVHWIAGHVGIADNERADALANRGVDGSRAGKTGVV